MGKIFPKVYSLKERPALLGPTLELIEKSFRYEPSHNFQTDFAPLIDESNHHHCYVLVDENEKVLAHVGLKERKLQINNSVFNICMLGGIAVAEEHRGQGHFHQLFQDVLAEKRNDACFFLLWSDQDKLYGKYGFHLCGSQYELSHQEQGGSRFTKSGFPERRQHVKDLYEKSFRGTYLTLERSEADWELLARITSSDLFVGEDGYFFKGKGQDLSGIIHEYGCTGDLPSFLNSIRSEGKVWMGAPLVETDQEQYQFMLCPGDLKLFGEFISTYTGGIFTLRNMNVMKQEIFFDFNQQTLVLPTPEFLTGIFGPGPFEELGEMKPIFFSGLDSI